MNQYVTGSVIKELREKKKLTQSELAQILSVSDKTVSKWETGKGIKVCLATVPLDLQPRTLICNRGCPFATAPSHLQL